MSVLERFEALNSPDNQMSREELHAQLEELRNDAVEEKTLYEERESEDSPESIESDDFVGDSPHAEESADFEAVEMSDRQKDIEELKEYRDALIEYQDTEQSESIDSSDSTEDSPDSMGEKVLSLHL